MRRSTCCLLVVLFGSWLSTLGQSAPKFTTPQIVATFQRLNQIGEISPTTIYTPKNWGTFRVSIVMVGTTGNGESAAFWSAKIDYTDGAGDTNFLEGDLLTSTPQTDGVQYPIRTKAGKPLKVSVTSVGNTSGSKYNVWVVVEQLM
jgi:hypothetical protein